MTTTNERPSLYVDGSWKQANGPLRAVENAYTGEVVAFTRDATPADVHSAVASARDAEKHWAGSSVQDRQSLLVKLRSAIVARRADFAAVIVEEVGTTIKTAETTHVDMTLAVIDSYIELVESFEFEENVGNTLVLKKPVGVVGTITPWNYPLYQLALKLAPALTAGCTVVAKPAELTPLSTLMLAEVFDQIDAPRGIFNVVTGPGQVVGHELAEADGVGMVSFTGSVEVGRVLAAAAGRNLKRVCLELGGKSASIVLPGADVEAASRATMLNVASNTGQSCAAWTRLLVPREELDHSLSVAAQTADSLVLGDPMDPRTDVGPLISGAQRDRVVSYIDGAVADGAKLASTRSVGTLDIGGNFVPPTVLGGLSPSARISQEEVFGPVLVVLPYSSLEEAVEIANGTSYGLGGAVWGDEDAALSMARALETGRVDLNGAAWNPAAPFGGMKNSGIGRELGRWGLEEYLETTSVQYSLPSSGGERNT